MDFAALSQTALCCGLCGLYVLRKSFFQRSLSMGWHLIPIVFLGVCTGFILSWSCAALRTIAPYPGGMILVLTMIAAAM